MLTTSVAKDFSHALLGDHTLAQLSDIDSQYEALKMDDGFMKYVSVSARAEMLSGVNARTLAQTSVTSHRLLCPEMTDE